MRIMLCPSAYAPHVGGVEELTRQLAAQYCQEGHEVMVLTARWPLTGDHLMLVLGWLLECFNPSGQRPVLDRW